MTVHSHIVPTEFLQMLGKVQTDSESRVFFNRHTDGKQIASPGGFS